MKQHKFSIIIPTRNRHETIKYTIETVTSQKYTDYEIIVFDNNSTAETKAIIDTFGSSKIRYYRSNESLAMSDSWERAVNYAEGDYCILIGSDDGLIPDALDYLNWVINMTNYKAIRWETIFYHWPSAFSNYLILPFNRPNKRMNSVEIILNTLKINDRYTLLPMLYYNSAIHIDLINDLKKKTGRIFNAVSPDIYTGFAFAYLSKEYLSLGTPLSIGGNSEKSNGTAALNQNKNNEITKDFESLYSTNSEIKYHPKFPFLMRSLSWIVAESFQQAKDKLFPKDGLLSIDYQTLIKHCMNDLKVNDINEWSENITKIRESIEYNHKLSSWFESYILTIKPKFYNINQQQTLKPGFNLNSLSLNATDFCSNIYEAALFCAKIYGENEKKNFRVEKHISQNLRHKIGRRLKLITKLLYKRNMSISEHD